MVESPRFRGGKTGGRRKKRTREEKRGSGRGEKPAAEKGHGKPQKLITDINTLTPWTLLLMYFLPFRPTGAHSIYRAGGTAAYRENFSPKKPSFPPTHTHKQLRILSSILFVYTYTNTHTHTTTSSNAPSPQQHSPVAPSGHREHRTAAASAAASEYTSAHGGGGELTNFRHINTRPFSTMRLRCSVRVCVRRLHSLPPTDTTSLPSNIYVCLSIYIYSLYKYIYTESVRERETE